MIVYANLRVARQGRKRSCHSTRQPEGATITTETERARALIADATRIVGFTGAGISTESGIPDFRSPDDGLWIRQASVTLPDFESDDTARVDFWRMARGLWPTLRDAQPNAGHHAFVELHRQGRLDLLVTQNVDSLHQRAGLPADQVIELHGAATEAVCLDPGCGGRVPAEDVYRRIEAGESAPRCERCNGLLKPAVILFCESLPPGVMTRAKDAIQHCDLLLVAGSSLEVEPAASLPRLAHEAGAQVVIVNRDATPHDAIAHAVVHGEIGAVLPALVRREDETEVMPETQ